MLPIALTVSGFPTDFTVKDILWSPPEQLELIRRQHKKTVDALNDVVQNGVMSPITPQKTGGGGIRFFLIESDLNVDFKPNSESK